MSLRFYTLPAIVTLIVFLTITKPSQANSFSITDTTKNDVFLEQLLQQYPQFFDSIIKSKTAFNVQIIYTSIDRGSNGIPVLKNHYFNVNADNYFYPASAVKLPVSILALQKINELKNYGVDRNTTIITEKSYSGQTAVYNDPTTPNGKPSIANYIRKVLMVSDNDAYNRLYEFLGQQYINEQLQQKGFSSAQILHRLEVALSEDENKHTNAVCFLGEDGNVLYKQAMQTNSVKYPIREDSIGTAYYTNNKLVNRAMDFSNKNRLSLEDLHSMLIALVFPNKVPASQRFNITGDDRKFLLKYMSELPTESSYPPYKDDSTYYPAYCKFLLFGAEDKMLPKNIRIFNKVGEAYGQLIDAAYIVDYENKIDFFLSAVIYCNSDGVLNDDKYEYDSIGFPFMKNLGEVIYNYELKRERKNLSDLSRLIFDYSTQLDN